MKINIEFDLENVEDKLKYNDFLSIADFRNALYKMLDRLSNEISDLKSSKCEEDHKKAVYIMRFYQPFIDDCLEVGIS